MHAHQAEGNFSKDRRNALELHVVQDYDRHMGYVNESGKLLLQ